MMLSISDKHPFRESLESAFLQDESSRDIYDLSIWSSIHILIIDLLLQTPQSHRCHFHVFRLRAEKPILPMKHPFPKG